MHKENPIESLFIEYMSECQYTSRLRPETIRGYTAVFYLFIQIMPEVNLVELLTKEMMLEFFKRLQKRERIVGKGTIKKGVKVSTIKTYWAKLNPFFTWLTHKKLLTENPLSKLKPPRITLADPRHLKNEAVRRIYSAITVQSRNSFMLRRDTAMVSFLFYCGIRLGEFISLEIRDIDMEKRFLTVRGETSKSKKVRLLPMHPTLHLHLTDYLIAREKMKYKSEYLIVSINSDSGLTKHGIKHWVKAIVAKSGVKFHIHQFRHTFAYNLAKNDVNATKIQKLLGHSSLDMTMTYLHSIDSKDLKDDIEKLSL